MSNSDKIYGAANSITAIMQHVELANAQSTELTARSPIKPTDTTVRNTANIEPPEEALPLGQAIRRYPRLVGYCLSLNIVVVGWGYDLVIVGSITGVDSFQNDYGQWYKGEQIIPALWLSLWTASIPLGMTFGSVFGGWLQDRIGRKMCLMTASIISAVGVSVIFFSYLPASIDGMRSMFFVGKVIQGFAIGTLKVTAMTFVSETAPTSLRASTMGLFPMSNLLGQLIGSIVVFACNDVKGKGGYLGAFGSQWLLAAAPLIISILLPESPAYLMLKDRREDALVSVEKLFAPRSDPLEALERIRISIEEEKALVAEASFVACFSSTHRRRTLLVVLANWYPMLFGLDLLSKSSYFVQTIGLASRTSLAIMIAGIVAGVLANAVGVWVLSRVGRRKITIVTLSIAGLIWTAIGVSGFWRGQGAAYFTAMAMMLVIVTCGVGVWPAAYAIMGETSSLHLRAKTQAIGGVAQQGGSVVMAFALPYVFNPDAGNLGGKTGFLFLGLCLIGVVLTWFVLPELKGRSIMEIDHMFNEKLPTREFTRWNGDRD